MLELVSVDCKRKNVDVRSFANHSPEVVTRLCQMNIRLYAIFSPAAVKEARWIKGDRLVVGSDAKSKCICFKRDQECGFTLGGSCFEKGRGNANLQVSTSSDSPLWSVIEKHIGKWMPVTSQGIMLIAQTE